MDIDSTPRSGNLIESDSHATVLADVGGHVDDDGSMEEGGDLIVESLVVEPVGYATICKTILKDVATPLLSRLDTPGLSRGGHSRKRVMLPTCSSLRQAARPSLMPVTQRAQWKLMRELQFIDTPAVSYQLCGHEVH